ncbi:hypothetical protein MBM_04458 [Drepanopeziza brunnea f. sp. 'multigermtubi' MB_m1]|uniref:Uncharacterized protein n=1 Tax=Marssonina brunnea f. sp. multigermtubi (strain MB_m1) TaxID=1072389 RepID=K1WYD8_MARBU|nr:uncharacterized protein MBM_04458 [Drepanopeziza brunnea f. sp. 'multigermtubi' MB_m1]EKD17597.1 hypothetical protein MBM_04458 [Drepanopeziza brunnea f. sp. 'multigermtubi' MB_m1]
MSNIKLIPAAERLRNALLRSLEPGFKNASHEAKSSGFLEVRHGFLPDSSLSSVPRNGSNGLSGNSSFVDEEDERAVKTVIDDLLKEGGMSEHDQFRYDYTSHKLNRDSEAAGPQTYIGWLYLWCSKLPSYTRTDNYGSDRGYISWCLDAYRLRPIVCLHMIESLWTSVRRRQRGLHLYTVVPVTTGAAAEEGRRPSDPHTVPVER